MSAIEDLFAKLAPVVGEQKMNRLWLLYQTETDLEKRRQIEGIVSSLAAKRLNENYQNNKILLPPPPDMKNEGILLGKVCYGDELRNDFYLPLNELPSHIGLWGSTGAGKTFTSFLILRQLLERGIPFWVMDWKRQTRHILSTRWARENEITVYTVGRNVVPFSFDPFDPPPGTDQEAWHNKLIDVLSESHFLGYGVRFILKTVLQNLQEYSLGNLLDSLLKIRATGRKREWVQSTIRAVADLNMTQGGKVFGKDSGVHLHELLKLNTIFELDGLPEDGKRFFTELLLAYVHEYLLNRSERDTIRNVILIEEAAEILHKGKEYDKDESVTNLVFRQLRELGCGLIALDQQPSLISKTVLNNTGTSIFMRLKHSDDVRAAADSLLLNPQHKEYLGWLQTGYAIVKTSRIPRPFLIQIPHLNVQKGVVTDSYLQKNRGLPSPSVPKADIPPDSQREKEKNNRENKRDTDLALMADILEHPISGVAERYRRLKLSASKGNNTKMRLIEEGLVREERVGNGMGTIQMLSITPVGREFLENNGISGNSLQFTQKYGGSEHRFWVEKVAQELREAGFSVQKEYPTGQGKSVDLVAESNGGRIAVEVETGKSNAMSNVKKNLSSNFDRVVVITTSEKERKKMLERLEGEKAGSTQA
jgi:signal recognition particle subunit SEC65